MALTEEQVEDKIEIVGDYKIIQVRTATVIKRDGLEISRSFKRHLVHPNDDVSNESDEVKAISSVVHTQAVKDAWAAYSAASRGA